MRKVFVFTICLGALLLGSLACGGSVRSSQPEDGGIEETQPQSAPQPTVTPFPTPPPPAIVPLAPPEEGSLAAIVRYANLMQPLLTDAGAILERDGEILKASEEGNDAVLCDGRLAADNVSMTGIITDVRAIQPPQDAGVIHDLVLQSGDAWIEALDNVEEFCTTGKQLYKIPAVLKFWEAAATLQDAGNRFWILILATGAEDWVQR
ncbi:MAG: hypothetical protein E3J30_06085 [Anaerolineales bacterium]|nr:MAG: hypothetical protein E3J30_06085 [Anaerolineales bacterium]